MCLGVPGRIEQIVRTEDGALMGDANFINEIRRVCLDYLPDLTIGDYIIVHAGYALSRLTEESALETIRMMVDLGLLDRDDVTPSESAVVAGIRPIDAGEVVS